MSLIKTSLHVHKKATIEQKTISPTSIYSEQVYDFQVCKYNLDQSAYLTLEFLARYTQSALISSTHYNNRTEKVWIWFESMENIGQQKMSG